MEVLKRLTFKVPPYKHQREFLELSTKWRDAGLLWDMGCLTGDTKVKVNRAGCSRTYTLESLYSKYKGWRKDIPTNIRALKDGRIGLHTVEGVVYSGVKDVFEVLLEDGKRVKATGDHKIMTIAGWVEASKLTPQHMVLIDNQTKHQSKSIKAVKSNNNYSYLRVGAYHPYGREALSRQGTIYRRVFKHRLLAEASVNNLSLKEFILRTKEPNNLVYLDPDTYAVHHINHDAKDNSIENLEVLTHADHHRIHGNGEHFGHGLLEYKHVKSVTHIGEQATYDIQCEAPYHNFVANGIVVHNSGKTKGLIDVLRIKYGARKRLLKTLILCPVVTIVNWEREILFHSKIRSENVVALDQAGSKKKLEKLRLTIVNRATGFPTQDKIVIANYEAMQNKELHQLLKDWEPEVVVCDEVHYIKNPKAQRSKNTVLISDKAQHRYMLTGTPILNNAEDIYMQFRFLDKGATFGMNFFSFQRTYMQDANSAWSHSQQHYPKWELREDKFADLHDKIYEKCTRVLKADCLDLPPLIRQNILLDMTPEQKKYYTQMERDLITFIDDSKNSGMSGAMVANAAIVKALRLMQISSGFLVLEDDSVINLKKNPKLDQVKEILEQIVSDHKVIIWCCFRRNYEQLKALCKRMDIGYAMLTGDQNTKQKQEAMDAFEKDPSTRVIIANRRAGGIGVNLVAASYSIIYSRNFSLGEELQSEARNYRGGSEIHKNITKIDLTMKDTIEEVVQEALSNKQNISDKIIDIYTARRKND